MFGRFLLSAALVLVTVGTGHAQILYGATGAGNPGELFTINPATGAMATDIGPLTDAGGTNYGVTGMAFNPVTGILYGSLDSHGPKDLVTINPATGRVTLIGPFNALSSGTMTDLAFTAAGQLYGINSNGGANLNSINILTGAATQVGIAGPTFTEGGGLAISLAGIFNGTPTQNNFGTYDPTTGIYTDITNPTKPAGGGAYSALAFSGTGVLYGDNLLVGGTKASHLVTIDPATGTVTDIGPSITALDAIAFSPTPVPEPSSLLLGGMAALLASFVRRRSLVRNEAMGRSPTVSSRLSKSR